MRYEKMITKKKKIVLDFDKDGGYLKIHDFTKNKMKNNFEEITLVRWGKMFDKI
jgi:hypothetical protein